jgi:hypothetical protein
MKFTFQSETLFVRCLKVSQQKVPVDEIDAQQRSACLLHLQLNVKKRAEFAIEEAVNTEELL